MYDLVIRGGRVLDPGRAVDERLDVAFHGGRVAAIEPSLEAAKAAQRLEASGLIVTPGWIDLHVHVYPGVSHYGILPDPTCLKRGATTVVDVGSAGAATFAGLRQHVVERSATRIYTFLHISRIGLLLGLELDPPLGELSDLRNVSVPEAVRCAEANRDLILGIKVRLTAQLAEQGRNELEALKRARQAADAVGLPLMVHFPDSSLGLPTILEHMRPGDILTHCFHARRSGILDGNGKVLPELRQAMQNGLILDVGHGVGSFGYAVARAAIDQGVLPEVISSDLHRYNLNGPVFDLAATLSKFLHLGLELPEVVRRATAAPAAAIGKAEELGTLAVGAAGDAVLFRIEHGRRPLADTVGCVEQLEQWIEPVYVIKAGRVVAQYTNG